MKNPITPISTGRAREIHGVEMTSVQIEHSLGILSIELPTPVARYIVNAIKQHGKLVESLRRCHGIIKLAHALIQPQPEGENIQLTGHQRFRSQLMLGARSMDDELAALLKTEEELDK